MASNEVMIGLEIHGYIDTKEKLFCSCKNFHDMKIIAPNANVCPICSGQPGCKPMLPNKSAIDKILEIGLMLNCKPNIAENKKFLVFQRKHYNWPDMTHGYQKTISGAYSIPVAENGIFEGIRIREVHLEEDPAAWNPQTGFVDYNRAGVPLVEIVTEPDFKNSSEVSEWLKKLVHTLSYIKALNKDAGIKADVNVNIRGVSERTEIKNVNSISEIVRAVDSETERHFIEEPKGRETRRWNSVSGKTELMRTKEEQADYRFIPDPDLPAIKISSKRIEELRKKLPETPREKLEKIIKKHKIGEKDAEVLTKNLEIAELFEKIVEEIPANIALPWITVEWLSVLNYNKKTMNDVVLNPEHMVELLELLQKNVLTPLKAKEILRKFIPSSFSPKSEASKSGVIGDKKEIEKIVDEVIKSNKKSVEDYKKGESKALNFLIGRVMEATQRRADFNLTKEIIEEKLKKI